MGFLNEQSLIMIVKTARNDLASFSFEFPGILHPAAAMSMSVGKVGPLRKIVIAARVNISVAVGWPELQIIRTIRDETPNTVFTTNATEPKPTGYLNLYEYDLVADKFDIQDGDTLNISWHGNILQHDQIRFSLAYYNNGTSPAIPMVSVVVGNCDPETDLLSLNTLYCEDVPVMDTDSINMIRNVTGTPVTRGSTVTMSEESTFATQASINSSTTSGRTIIISGAVVFSLLLLLILLCFVVVLTFVVKRRRKSASVNVFDPNEMSTQPRILHNAPSESIMDANQASTTQEVKQDEAVDYIEIGANQASGTDTLPTDPNVAYGTIDCIEMDPNQAYGTNTVPTNPNVAYGTHPPQTHYYEYVALP